MPNHFSKIPHIDQSLQALQVHESRVRPDGATLLQAELARTDGKISTTHPELWLSTTGPIGVDALIRAMARVLRERQHDFSTPVAGLVLAHYAANSAPPSRSADGIDRFLQRIVEATAEITFVIPALQGITGRFRIGSFQFERTDLRRLKDLCERVGCDYAHRYAAHLEGTQSIRSAPIPCRVIQKDELLQAPTPTRYRIYDDYMGAVAQGIRNATVRTFTEETALLSIIHEWMFPLERIIRHAPLTSIALFRETAHRNSRGWVVPVQPYFQVVHSTDFWPAGEAIAASWSGSPIGALSVHDDLPVWLLGPSRLAVSAMAHHGGMEWDLAGLLATTAIELILCESSSDLQRSVSRLGECICRHAGTPAGAISGDRIKGLYDARSKFVHEGRSIGESESRDLVLVARAVIRAAARASAASGRPRTFDRSSWLLKLDAVRGGDAAGLPVSPEVLRMVGLID